MVETIVYETACARVYKAASRESRGDPRHFRCARSPGRDRASARTRHHHGRADAGGRLDRRTPPAAARSFQLLGLQPAGAARTRPAPRARLAAGPRCASAVDALHRSGTRSAFSTSYSIIPGESDEFGADPRAARASTTPAITALRAGAPAALRQRYGLRQLSRARSRAGRAARAGCAARLDAAYGGVDGFRFDLGTALGAAATLSRTADSMRTRPCSYGDRPGDAGSARGKADRRTLGRRPGRPIGLKRCFPSRFAEWNDRFRDDVRRYWRGDDNASGRIGRSALAAPDLAGSADVFARQDIASLAWHQLHRRARRLHALADLVSICRAQAQQEANGGGENRDGTERQISPGTTASKGRATIRQFARGARAATSATCSRRCCSRAVRRCSRWAPNSAQPSAAITTPMRRTTPTSWLDVERGPIVALLAFAQRLVALRRAHPALRADRFLDGAPFDESGIRRRRMAVRGTATLASAADWASSGDATLVAVFCAANGDQPNDRVAFVTHRGGEAITLELPERRDSFVWRRVVDTAENSGAAADDAEEKVHIAAHRGALFVVFVDVASAAKPIMLAASRGSPTSFSLAPRRRRRHRSRLVGRRRQSPRSQRGHQARPARRDGPACRNDVAGSRKPEPVGAGK